MPARNHTRTVLTPKALCYSLTRPAIIGVGALSLFAACAAGEEPNETVIEETTFAESVRTIPDFTKSIPDGPTMSVVSGTRELLIVCMDKGTPDPMPSLADIQAVTNKVQAYFQENSAGRLSISNVMFRGCGGSTGTYRSSSVDPPVPQQWTEALNQAVASGFNFRAYDRNGDGNITGDELGIAVIRQTPANWDYGTQRVASFQAAGGSNMTATIADIYFSAGLKTVQWGLLSHELLHNYTNAVDLYSDGVVTAWRPDWYSLMAAHWNANHLDPIHKLKFGWSTPTVRMLLPQTFFLKPVESTGAITILSDSHGAGEYFVIENRSRSAGTFDANLPGDGVLVWRVVEDSNLAAKYSPSKRIERWGWQLLTAAPLQPGQAFDLPWLEGATGYQFSVIRQVNGVAMVGIKPATGRLLQPVTSPGADPTGLVRADGVTAVYHRDSANRVAEITMVGDRWSPFYLGNGSIGSPSAYTRSDGTSAVLYRNTSNQIWEWTLTPQGWSPYILATSAASNPAGYIRSDGMSAVLFRDLSNQVIELTLTPRGWSERLVLARNAAGTPIGYVRSDGTTAVLYRDNAQQIIEMTLTPSGWSLAVLGSSAAGDPRGYVRADGTTAVLYRNTGGQIIERTLTPQGWSQATLGQAAGNAFGYVRGDMTTAVLLRDTSNRIVEYTLTPAGWSPAYLSNGCFAPVNTPSGDPAGYVRSDGVSSVLYQSAAGHVIEMALTSSGWRCTDLTTASGLQP